MKHELSPGDRRIPLHKAPSGHLEIVVDDSGRIRQHRGGLHHVDLQPRANATAESQQSGEVSARPVARQLLPCSRICLSHLIENCRCSVCLSDMTDGSVCSITMCNHMFHRGCVDEWIAACHARISVTEGPRGAPPCPYCKVTLHAVSLRKVRRNEHQNPLQRASSADPSQSFHSGTFTQPTTRPADLPGATSGRTDALPVAAIHRGRPEPPCQYSVG